MELGVFELDSQGRRCFRPDTPAFPVIDDVIDRLEPAAAALRKLDRALAAWPQPERVGRLFAALDAVHSCGADGSSVTFSELMAYRTSLRVARDAGEAAGRRRLRRHPRHRAQQDRSRGGRAAHPPAAVRGGAGAGGPGATA